MIRRTPPRPVTRTPGPTLPPEKRAHFATGRERLEVALTRYRHQFRPGAFHVLLIVEFADLHRTTDVRLIDDVIRARLARPESRSFLIAPFDPRDAVGELPGDHRPASLSALWMAPTGLDGGPTP